MTIDTDDLLKMLAERNVQLKKDSEVVKNIQAEERATQVDTVRLMESARDNSVIVKQGELLREQNAAQNSLKYATAVGTNMNDSTEIMTTLGKELRGSVLNSVQADKRVQSNLNARFLDDPINWVAAQFDLESSVKTAEAASKQSANISQGITKVQASTQQVVQTNLALAQVKTSTEMSAALDKTKEALDITINQQRLASLSMDKQGIAELNNLNQQQLANLHTGVNVKIQNEQINMQRQQFAQQKKMNELAIEDRQMRLQKDQLAEQDKQTMMRVFVDGAAVLGKDLSGIPANKLEMMMKFNPESKDYLRVGLNTLSTNHPVISDSAGEAGMIIMNTGAPLAAHQTAMKDWLVSSVQQAASGAIIKDAKGKQVMTDRSDPKTVALAANYLAVTGAVAQQSNVKFGDATNIYKAPPLPVVAGLPAVRDTAFGQKVLAPALASGVLQDFNPEQIKAMVIKAIKDKTITYDEAVSGGNSVFQGAVSYNNTVMNYKGFGLPNQQGFKAEVSGASSMGFKGIVNLADANEFRRLIDRQLAVDASLQQQQQTLGNAQNPFGRF